MNKVLGTLALVLIFVLPAVIAGSQEVATDSGAIEFQVEIVMDTTISIPALCENASASTVPGVLEFSPGITGTDFTSAISATAARPDDSCGTGTSIGDYNITNEGNVYINMTFKLNESAPTGIYIAVGDEEAYNENWTQALTTTDSLPLWGQFIPATGNDIVKVWQRVGADDTASGDTTFFRQIIISSQKS